MLKRPVMIILVIYMATAMIISPHTCINAGENALKLCGDTVIPTLFPFIFCGNMLIALGVARIMSRFLSKFMKPLFGVSGSGALAMVLGFVSGYPVGAVCAASLYKSGECTKCEAERLLAFCNNSGPMFVIGAIGAKMANDVRIGVLLYVTHLLSALLCGMIFKNYGREEHKRCLPPARDKDNIKTALPDIGEAVSRSVDTILLICGFIVIFAVFTAILPDTPVKKYIYSFLEITGGIKELFVNFNIQMLPVIAGFMAFSGVSVLAQVIAVIKPAGLSVKPYILGKTTQAVIAYLLMFLASFI